MCTHLQLCPYFLDVLRHLFRKNFKYRLYYPKEPLYTQCQIPRETGSFVFPRVLMFPETKWRATSGLCWKTCLNVGDKPRNSFCSILLLNNSHVFLLLKKQPLLHDVSSTVSCAFFALTFNSAEWKKTLIRLSLSMRPEVVGGRCMLDKALLTCLKWKWKISRHLLFLCFKVTKCY